MTFDELKKLVAEKIKEFPQYKERALLELRRAKWCYDDGINIADEILISDKKCDNRYVLPFFLGKTSEVDLSKPLETIQIKDGGSGGLDIDTDYEPAGKEELKKWLIEKYGADRVMGVGTYNTNAITSAAKDILRKIEVPFNISNEFCKNLQNDISWEENMANYRQNFPDFYKLYELNKPALDMVPKIVGQIRNCIPGYQTVNTSNGKKKISEVCSEDKIAFLNNRGEIRYTNFYKKIWSGKKDIYEIELENGKKIAATKGHIFFTANGLKKLEDLTTKDELLTI